MLSEQIKDLLLAQIIRGEIKPGERLVESRIAAAMQTSQAPVRDAIRDLGTVGVVEIRRNKGAVVRQFDREELAQIYAVRAELEGMAVERAALDHAEQVGPELLGLCDQMEAAVEAGDMAAFVDLNTRFHRTIVTASGNRPLVEIWDRLDIQSRTAMNVSATPKDFGTVHADHRAIAKAVLAGQADEARRALVTHVNAVVR
jgi:DNA-binding GntR family transcriptional regulator